MPIDKHNSLQFLFFARAKFEEFGEKDGVLVENIPFELRDRFCTWVMVRPSREHFCFDEPGRGVVVTREGWEEFICWIKDALGEKLASEQAG